jgi:hypothetical protein
MYNRHFLRLALWFISCCLAKQRPHITWQGLQEAVFAPSRALPKRAGQADGRAGSRAGSEPAAAEAYRSLMLQLIGRVTRPQPSRDVTFW